jgi:hypothetical protein
MSTEFNAPVSELINNLANQMAAIIDITVRIAAIIPIFLDRASFCFKYFHAYQNPNGGRSKLTEYTVISFDDDAAETFPFCGFPQ